MNIPTKTQILSWLTSAYTINETLPGACHCLNVGFAMEAVAKKTVCIDPEQAKVIGFLHDVGKMDPSTNPSFQGEKRAHDIVGFDFLLEKGFPEIAYGSLTHSLLSKDLTNEYNRVMFFNREDDIQRIQELLKGHIYTDTEKLLQLLDWIIQKDHVCTIENSYEFIKNDYGHYNGLDDCYKEAVKFKSYFDDLCQLDIYSLCDTVIIKKWDTAHFEQFISNLI